MCTYNRHDPACSTACSSPLGNHIAGYYVAQRAMNMVTKVLRHCLETCLASVIPGGRRSRRRHAVGPRQDKELTHPMLFF